MPIHTRVFAYGMSSHAEVFQNTNGEKREKNMKSQSISCRLAMEGKNGGETLFYSILPA